MAEMLGMTVEEVGHRMTLREMAEWSIEFTLRGEDKQRAELQAEADRNLARLQAKKKPWQQ